MPELTDYTRSGNGLTGTCRVVGGEVGWYIYGLARTSTGWIPIWDFPTYGYFAQLGAGNPGEIIDLVFPEQFATCQVAIFGQDQSYNPEWTDPNPGPLPVDIPEAPVLIRVTRNGSVGTATVNNVVVGNTVEAWAIPFVTDDQRVFLGSAAGTGAEQIVDLDLSLFYSEMFGAVTPCIIEVVTKNADSAYGPTSINIIPIIMNPTQTCGMALTRLGTTITIAITGIGAADQALVLYTDLNGVFRSKYRSGPGDILFTNMSSTHAYSFVCIWQDSLGAWIGSGAVKEEGFTINAPTITAEDDGTGISLTVTISGDAGATHSVFYRRAIGDPTAWTLSGTRTGNGPYQITGLSPGIHEVIVVSTLSGSNSLPSDAAVVNVLSTATVIPETLTADVLVGAVIATLQADAAVEAKVSARIYPNESNVKPDSTFPMIAVLFEKRGGLRGEPVIICEGEITAYASDQAGAYDLFRLAATALDAKVLTYTLDGVEYRAVCEQMSGRVYARHVEAVNKWAVSSEWSGRLLKRA